MHLHALTSENVQLRQVQRSLLTLCHRINRKKNSKWQHTSSVPQTVCIENEICNRNCACLCPNLIQDLTMAYLRKAAEEHVCVVEFFFDPQ